MLRQSESLALKKCCAAFWEIRSCTSFCEQGCSFVQIASNKYRKEIKTIKSKKSDGTTNHASVVVAYFRTCCRRSSAPIFLCFSSRRLIQGTHNSRTKLSADIDDDKKKENEEDEFKAWSTERFFYMTFARIFPFSHCGFLNIGSGILHYLIPLNEFIGSTVLGACLPLHFPTDKGLD